MNQHSTNPRSLIAHSNLTLPLSSKHSRTARSITAHSRGPIHPASLRSNISSSRSRTCKLRMIQPPLSSWGPMLVCLCSNSSCRSRTCKLRMIQPTPSRGPMLVCLCSNSSCRSRTPLSSRLPMPASPCKNSSCRSRTCKLRMVQPPPSSRRRDCFLASSQPSSSSGSFLFCSSSFSRWSSGPLQTTFASRNHLDPNRRLKGGKP